MSPYLLFKKKKSFTILEVLIAFAILAISTGLIYSNLNGLIQKKTFLSEKERLERLIISSRTLAISTKTDWKLYFSPRKILLICQEDKAKIIPIPIFKKLKISMNESEVCSIDFFSTGFFSPQENLYFEYKNQVNTLNVGALLNLEYDEKATSIHPSEIEKSTQI
jgi:type II secretory pathway pseudopilin PulG